VIDCNNARWKPELKYVCVRAVHWTSVDIRIYMFFGQKFGKAGSWVCTLESAWHVPVNVTIRWLYRYKSASAIARDDILALACSFRNVRRGLALPFSLRWQRHLDNPRDYEVLLSAWTSCLYRTVCSIFIKQWNRDSGDARMCGLLVRCH